MLQETIGKAVQLYSMYRIQAARAMEGSGAGAGGQGAEAPGTRPDDPSTGAVGAGTGAGEAGASAGGAGARLKKLKELSESARRPQRLLREALELLPETFDDRARFLDELRRLADWYPSSVDIRAALAGELAGEGKTAEAREVWRELTERFAFYYQGHLGAGRSYEQEGRYGRALLSYRRALDLASQEPEVYRHLRELYRRQANIRGYLQLLEEQMLKDAYNPLLYEEAADAAEASGDTEKAKQYRRRAEELREGQ